EELVVELREAVGRERPAVQPLQVLEHPLLTREVDEVDPVPLLVALQLRNEREALVHELDERAVEIGDIAAHAGDVLVAGDVDAGHRSSSMWAVSTPSTRSSRVTARTARSASRTCGSDGCPATTASKR